MVSGEVNMSTYIYTVTAYRYGDRERHSYVVGCFDTETAATKIAIEEEFLRGGKYSCEVVEIPLSGNLEGGEFKIIWSMKKTYKDSVKQDVPTRILLEILNGVVINLQTTSPEVKLFLADHDCIKEHGDDIKEVLEHITTVPVEFDAVLTNAEFDQALYNVKGDY